MSKFFEKFVRPILFKLPAETAHEIGIGLLETGFGSAAARRIASNEKRIEFPYEVERFGLKFKNPIGIAAGFDKNARVVDQLEGLGFGFVETGTVTLRPQPGNEKPRMFRLPAEEALINRLGFNNDGAAVVAERLSKIDRRCPVGVNIGKNKDVPNEEAVENYVSTLEIVHPVAEYVAVNISSPNTPDLRELQRSENLDHLLSSLQKRNDELGTKPLLVKIAPDLSESEIKEIVDICSQYSISGMIATNTTISREGLSSKEVSEIGAGGLSGRPLTARSTEVIATIFRHSRGKMPVIGVGGIFNSADAFEKVAAGACLLQAYTGFIYGGPSFATDITSGLAQMLEREGFSSWEQAVGCRSEYKNV